MKGDGEDSGVGDFLTLGGSSSQSASSSRSGGERERDKEREGCSGREAARHAELSSLLMTSPSFNVLSSLSRNGLAMLAGGSTGGFSLKPPAMGNLGSLGSLQRSSNLGVGKVSGGGFTGFYRASANKGAIGTAMAMAMAEPRLTTTSLVLPGTKLLRFDEFEAREEAMGSAASSNRSGIAAGKMEQQPVKTPDVENLTSDECWRLILKLGSRWPAWNGATTARRQQQAPQGVMKDRSSTKDEQRVQGGNLHGLQLGQDALQLGQDALRLLATRALEALAQAPPDRHGRSAGGMLAPKCTTQETPKTKAAAAAAAVRDLPLTPASKPTHQTLATIVQQPSLLAKVPVTSSSLDMPAPKNNSSESRTAPLTIFYAGTVNVCDNVPEDKARLIMLFAGKASAPRALTDAPPPSEIVQPHEELQLSKPSSEVVAPSATHAKVFSSDENPVECSNLTEIVPLDVSPTRTKIFITEGKSRQHRQQGTAKPLPNARKNSLARFLDSRKRNRPKTSSSESQPTKKPGLGSVGSDGCPNDGEDAKGNGQSPMALCSQSSIDSQEGILASCTHEVNSL